MQNRFFDIESKKTTHKQEQQSANFNSRYLLAHYQKLRSLQKELGRLPENEEFFFLQTDASFNAFTFIPFVGKDQNIKRLFASTYSISRRVIDALVELYDAGIIEEITLLISDSMIKRNSVTIDILQAMANIRTNIKVLFAWVHAKVCLMETCNAYYTIEGSGNWSENAHYEQYVFANSRGLYDFRMELFTNSKIRCQ